MNNYAIYLRKSRADFELEANGELETLARHEKALLDLAKRQKLNITAIYKEVVSGETISSRPEVQKLLHQVELGSYYGVLVMEIERLARGDTIDQGVIAQAFKQSNTKIVTPLKTYDPNNEFDEEYFEFGLFMSRREYKTINRRIQHGRLASVNDGKFISSTPPFGYDKVKIQGDKGYTLSPNEESQVVKLIFDLYTQRNIGMTLVALELDKLHIKPRYRDTWSKSTIRDILTNPVYIGKIRWSYKKETKFLENGIMKKNRKKSEDHLLIDGLHPAIIDEDMFEQARLIMSSKGHAPVKSSQTLKNPLTGLIFCAKCGAQMTRLSPNSRNKYDTIKCPNRECNNVSAPLYLVENKLLDSLKKWHNEYKLKLSSYETNDASLDLSITNKDNIINQIKNKTQTVQKQLDNTYDLLEQGIYSKEKFLERNNILSKKLTQLTTELRILEEEIESHDNLVQVKENFIPQVEYVLDGYNKLSDASVKNQLLKSVIIRVEYAKNSRNKRGNLENDNFELTIYPIVPFDY